MSDKYVIYYLQTRACVVEWPGQCHFLLCRWQSLKQSVWTDGRVTGVDRDISTSVPLELFAKTLETGNILQQVTTNYLKWSHAGLMLETVNITQGFCCVSQLWWHGGYVTSEHLLEHLSPHLKAWSKVCRSIWALIVGAFEPSFERLKSLPVDSSWRRSNCLLADGLVRQWM